MLVIGYYIFCSISNKSKLKENSNSLHGVCIEYASNQRFSNQSIISPYACCVSYSVAKKVTRNSSESIFIQNMQGNIFHIAQTQKEKAIL